MNLGLKTNNYEMLYYSLSLIKGLKFRFPISYCLHGTTVNIETSSNNPKSHAKTKLYDDSFQQKKKRDDLKNKIVGAIKLWGDMSQDLTVEKEKFMHDLLGEIPKWTEKGKSPMTPTNMVIHEAVPEIKPGSPLDGYRVAKSEKGTIIMGSDKGMVDTLDRLKENIEMALNFLEATKIKLADI